MSGWRPPKRPTLVLGSFGPTWWPKPYRVLPTDVATHMHVIGVSGSGKSRFLAGLFLSLLRARLPATLVDPHGDLAKLVLAHLVAGGTYRSTRHDAFERVLYLDFPAAERRGLCVPFNVFDVPGSPTTIASHVLDAFHRAWPALADGAAPRFDKLVQRGIKVLISNTLPLPALEAFLSDKAFRAQLLAQEPDADTVRMFAQQFDRLSPREQIDYADSTLSRITLLTQDPFLKYSLSAPTNLLNFRTLMDNNQSAVINLDVENGGTERLLGCLITVLAEKGASSRGTIAAGERRGSHHLIIDEFQQFAATSEAALSDMLSQTRKYGLFLVMSHQSWSQASSRLRGGLQNVGLEVVFRLGRQDAEYSATTLGRVTADAIKHQVEDETAIGRTHPVFYSLAEQWESWVQAIQDLPKRQAFMRLPGGDVTKVRTLPIPDPPVDRAELAEVEAEYQRRYFLPMAEVARSVADPPAPELVTPTVRKRPLPRREVSDGWNETRNE